MSSILGTWIVSGHEGEFSSVGCKITFIDHEKVVFEEELKNGQVGRFWFYYSIDTNSSMMILTPVNSTLKSLYGGKKRTLSISFAGGNLIIKNSDKMYSKFSRVSTDCIPEDGDLFPRMH